MNELVAIITLFILTILGVISYYRERLKFAWQMAFERDTQIQALQQEIRELRSRMPAELLTEADIEQQEAEAEAEALMQKYQAQKGAFS